MIHFCLSKWVYKEGKVRYLFQSALNYQLACLPPSLDHKLLGRRDNLLVTFICPKRTIFKYLLYTGTMLAAGHHVCIQEVFRKCLLYK